MILLQLSNRDAGGFDEKYPSRTSVKAIFASLIYSTGCEAAAAQATHLLTQVIDNPATSAATRHHAQRLLAQWDA